MCIVVLPAFTSEGAKVLGTDLGTLEEEPELLPLSLLSFAYLTGFVWVFFFFFKTAFLR